MFGRAALNRLGDDLARLFGSRLARLVLQALDEIGGVAARIRLDLAQQDLFRLVGRHARNSLELAFPLLGELLGALCMRRGLRLAFADRGLAVRELPAAVVDGGRALVERARLLASSRSRLASACRLDSACSPALRAAVSASSRSLCAASRAASNCSFALRLGVAQQARCIAFGAADDVSGGAPSGGQPSEQQDAARQQEDDAGCDARCKLAHVSRPGGLTGSRAAGVERWLPSGAAAGARCGQ